MTHRKLVPDMSSSEGIEKAFAHIREHVESDPLDVELAVNLEILRVLQEEGVEEAETLEERLKETAGSGESLYRSIGDLAAELTEEQEAAASGDEHIELKRMAGVASVVSDITSAAFAAATGNGDQGALILKEATDKFAEIGASEEGELAKSVLGNVISDMVSVLPVPES